MKKLLLILLLSLVTTATAMAYSFQAKNSSGMVLYYNINDDNQTVTVTNVGQTGKYTESTVVIPMYVQNGDKEYKVTTIGKQAFMDCGDIVKVTLPNSISEIQEEAFRNCVWIDNPTLGTYVEKIGAFAFSGCSRLVSITLPSSVKAVGGGAFSYCPKLETIESPLSSWYGQLLVVNDVLVAVAPAKFDRPTQVTGIKEIGPYVYASYNTFKEIRVESSVTKIGEGAFKGCSKINQLELSSALTTVEADAFNGCSGLTSLSLPSELTTIGERAFQDCSGLQTVDIAIDKPSNLQMSADVFKNTPISKCTLAVPNGTSALYGATSIWKDFKSISEMNFDFCKNSEENVSIYYRYNSDKKSVYVTFKTEDYQSYQEEKVVVPASVNHNKTDYAVTAIGDYAFKDCTIYRELILPASITSIGNCAFQYLKYLSSIELPAAVTRIGDHAFHYAELENITMPESLTSIGDYAFCYCKNLTSIEIPAPVTSIGKNAFFACTALTSLTARPTHPANIKMGESVFLIVPVVDVLFTVPKGCADKYQCLDQWKEFNSLTEDYYSFMARSQNVPIYYIINDDQTTVTVTHKDYNSESYMGNVVIPTELRHVDNYYKVTAIGEKAFQWCTGLVSVDIPSSVKRIDDFAFYACFYLESMTVRNTDPESITVSGVALEGVPDDTAILYVPKNCKAKYEKVSPWKWFQHIVEIGSSGIENIGNDNDSDIETIADGFYYDLNGRRVENPTRGIYIHKGHKVLVK